MTNDIDEIKILKQELNLLKEENARLKNNTSSVELSQIKDSLDFLPELIFEMDLSQKITFVNQQGAEKFGFSTQEFIDNITIKTFFPDDYELVFLNLSKLLSNSEFEKSTYWASKKNGERVPVILSASPVKKDGVVSGVRGVLIDVTEQVELEDRFKNLFHSSPFPTVIFNPETGKVFMLNPTAAKFLNIDIHKIADENIFFYIQDFGKMSFRNYVKNIKEDDFNIKYNTILITKSNLEKNIQLTSTEIHISGTRYIQSVIQDVTKDKNKSLKEISERKQKELLALSVFQLNQYKDKDSMFEYISRTLYNFNPKSTVMIADYLPKKNKWKLNHVLGVRASKISKILNIDIDTFELDVIDYQQPENRLFIDIEILLEEANYKNTNFSKIKFGILKKILGVKKIFTTKLIVNKKILGAIAVLTPNENFLIENEFIEIFISQANIILDRISYEKQLVKAKEDALEADRLKTVFLSNMSHEIRTPMNSILGFSSLILEKDLTEDLKNKYASLIQNSGDILVKLIDDIIDISKIESNQLLVSKQEFEINEILEELKLEYDSFNDDLSKDFRINFRNNDISVKIKSDRNRIKQILNNLINNATKFTNKGVIDIWFEYNNSKVLFHVKDTGIGISKSNQSIIFDRFRQTDESSSSPYRGTGLGLAISKHLAILLGGDILVDSQKNIGTEFIVSIPSNVENFVVAPKNIVKPTKEVVTDWKGYTVYIAEDELSNYLLLEAFLKDTNINFEWFKNGELLIDAVAKKRPDLILLDLKMPVLDGYKSAEIIKKTYPDLYIIAQTAYAMADEKNKAINAGCDDFITKPLKKNILFYKIARFLNK